LGDLFIDIEGFDVPLSSYGYDAERKIEDADE
jgi:hypothetical protein